MSSSVLLTRQTLASFIYDVLAVFIEALAWELGNLLLLQQILEQLN